VRFTKSSHVHEEVEDEDEAETVAPVEEPVTEELDRYSIQPSGSGSETMSEHEDEAEEVVAGEEPVAEEPAYSIQTCCATPDAMSSRLVSLPHERGRTLSSWVIVMGNVVHRHSFTIALVTFKKIISCLNLALAPLYRRPRMKTVVLFRANQEP
jgi:hypothetical protein